MNIRELWDTVVLRDLLGYTFPGLVTLFALALPWFTQLEQGARCWPHLCALWTDFRWPILGALLLLAFVVGHLQMRIIECFDEWVPGWKLGNLALRYLRDPHEIMGRTYLRVALDFFDRDRTLREVLSDHNLAHGCANAQECPEDGAKALWKLCDYYVLNVQPAVHATYMGRYYVLAVLFSNLGLSAVVMAVSLALNIRPLSPPILLTRALAILAACAVLLAALAISRCRRTSQDTDRKRALCVIDAAAVAVAIVASLLAPLMGREVLPGWLLLLGLVMIYSSGHFRKQFVERAFAIFYVLARGDSEPSEQPPPAALWSGCGAGRVPLALGMAAAALGYWLRGRISRTRE